MMLPYGLKIETVSSGFDALNKIKRGDKYDIIFMDHMMPKMDGIETTKKLHEAGYTHPIVALTANALAGTATMFLENGFDGFISKPIDLRELNSLLNRMIRDKQPPEVLEEARRQVQQQKIDFKLNQHKRDFSKIVIQDIKKALAALEDMLPKIRSGSEAEIGLFTTTVHGMKSALLNIGEAELSAVALNLERAGGAGEVTEIATDTPAFMDALRTVIKKHTPDEANQTDEISDEDKAYLAEKLSEIKTACQRIQKRVAKTALDELKSNAWPREVNELIDEISMCLLHGEFKKIVSVVDDNEYIKKPGS